MTSAFEELKKTPPVGAPFILGRFHKDAISHRGFLMELMVYLKNLTISGRDGPKFLIIGRARSGTTLLMSLLNAVPDIQCEGELLHFRTFAPRFFLNQLARKRNAPVWGCKIISYQLFEVQGLRRPHAFMRALDADGFRFIHAVRDTLDQSLSLSIAQKTRRFFNESADRKGRPKADGPVTLDPERFVAMLRSCIATLRFEEELLAPFRHETVIYERDLRSSADHDATVRRLCAFVGARPAPTAPSVTKVLKGGFDDLVANAADVRRAVEAAGLGDVFARS